MDVVKSRAISRTEFDRIFEAVKNWGRWGVHDSLGTLNYIGPEAIRAAAALVTTGRRVSMSLPINVVAGPDNPQPALHLVRQAHDGPSQDDVRFARDFFAIDFHGDCHSHVDALCHVSYRGLTYNGLTATDVMDSTGANALTIDAHALGLVGRGVLLDVARYLGVEWLELGYAVTADELERCARAQNTEVRDGDILVFRTGHHARRLALGPWNVSAPPAGEGKAGLHVNAIPWMHDRRIAAFLPDGDGETTPSSVEGVSAPIHPLQVTAMGMLTADSLQLEDVAGLCAELGRWEFMVVGLPLRIPRATGSPWNPIAIF